MCRTVHFNPRPPVRGATLFQCQIIFSVGFQSTPPCAGGDPRRWASSSCVMPFQSTPPCAGGDLLINAFSFVNHISIHAPLCGGRLYPFSVLRRNIPDFNPRPPVRGATQSANCQQNIYRFQSTPPCAGGDVDSIAGLAGIVISIHAPLCGGRPVPPSPDTVIHYFNPRPPVRGATLPVLRTVSTKLYFNPRPPVRGATNFVEDD